MMMVNDVFGDLAFAKAEFKPAFTTLILVTITAESLTQ